MELQIVMEFCELGSLDTYLSNNRDRFMNQLDSHGAVAFYAAGGSNNAGYILTQDLVKWCLEGARALKHLHAHNVWLPSFLVCLTLQRSSSKLILLIHWPSR